MAGTHARFAPSSAHRVVVCPGSLLPNEQEPDDSTFEAVEGTVAHYIHEHCLNWNGRSAEPFKGMHPVQFMPEEELTEKEWELIPFSRGFAPETDFIVTQELVDYVDESVLRCMELPGVRYVEQRVDISRWCPEPDQKGTADFFACSPGVLHVADLKYGIGVRVFAELNYQAILYALGVIEEFDWLWDFEEVHIHIHQPRLGHYDTWVTTKAELLAIGEYIRERFTLALQPDAPFDATEKACQFCKIKYRCAHLAQTVLDHFDIEDCDTKDDVMRTSMFLSDEEQVRIFKRRKLYELLIDSIEEDIKRRLDDDPKSVPGLKLVNGRSTRYWKDKQAALDELLFADIPEDELFHEREMKSPAQVEELNKKLLKPIVAALTEKAVGKPVIADADDKRADYLDDNSVLALTHFDAED